MKDEILSFYLGIIHLARTQNFPKKNIYYHLIRTDPRAYEMERNFNFSENFAYVLNEWSPLDPMRITECCLRKFTAG